MSSTRSKRKPITGSHRRRVTSTSSPNGSESRKRTRAVELTPSGGNVFADIGFPHAEQVLFKADLAIAIGDVIRRRRLTQSAAGKIVGIDQPKVSALLSGDTRGFSADRLIKILTRLGQDVEIRVLKSRRGTGRVHVAA